MTNLLELIDMDRYQNGFVLGVAWLADDSVLRVEASFPEGERITEYYRLERVDA